MLDLIARVDAYEIRVHCAGCEEKSVRVERHGSDGLRAISQESRVRLPLRYQLAGVDVEELDLVPLCADGENGRVFMHAQRSEVVCGGLDGLDRLVHTNVPQLDFTVSTSGDELTLPTALEMHVGYPLSVFFPYFDHGGSRLLTLVVNSYGTIAKTGYEDVSFNLVRC